MSVCTESDLVTSRDKYVGIMEMSVCTESDLVTSRDKYVGIMEMSVLGLTFKHYL